MKKNYFYPETETISLKSGVLMGSDPMHNPGGDDWAAPSRKGLYM